jgi:hypothetical protein
MKNFILLLLILIAGNSFGQQKKLGDSKKIELKFKKKEKVVRYDFKGYSFFFDEKLFFKPKWNNKPDPANHFDYLNSVDRSRDTIFINPYFTDSLISQHTDKYLKWSFRSIANFNNPTLFSLRKSNSSLPEKYVIEVRPTKDWLSDKVYYSVDDTLLFYAKYTTIEKDVEKTKGYLSYKGPWGVTGGWVYQTYTHNLDLEVKKYSKSFEGEDMPGLVYSYVNLGAELWYNNKINIAPKAGFGTTLFILNLNVNFIAYNDNFSTWRPAIVPEIGFSLPFYNLINVTYGYNFYLTNDPIMSTQTNRVSLKFNFPFFKKQYYPTDM